MNFTNQILDLLADGKWRSFMQVARSLDMQFSDLGSNIQFLSKYGLVEVGDDLMEVRMTEDYNKVVSIEYDIAQPSDGYVMKRMVDHEYPDLPSARVRMAWKGKDIADS